MHVGVTNVSRDERLGRTDDFGSERTEITKMEVSFLPSPSLLLSPREVTNTDEFEVIDGQLVMKTLINT